MSEKENGWVPTDQQLAFSKDVIETSFDNITESYRKAYPKASSKWASQEAYQLLRNPKIKALIEQLQQDMRSKFVLLAPAALERLEDLAENADSEMVKLAANKEILDRGGLRAPDKVELSMPDIFGSITPDEIKKRIKEKQEERESALKKMVKSEPSE